MHGTGDGGIDTDKIDKIATSVGLNLGVKEGLIEFTKKSGDIGRTGNNYLKATKFLDKITGGVSAYTAWVDYQNNPNTANKIKLATNIGLVALRINPFVSLGIGILDLSGGTDWMYNQAGDYWDKNWGGQER